MTCHRHRPEGRRTAAAVDANRTQTDRKRASAATDASPDHHYYEILGVTYSATEEELRKVPKACRQVSSRQEKGRVESCRGR